MPQTMKRIGQTKMIGVTYSSKQDIGGTTHRIDNAKRTKVADLA